MDANVLEQPWDSPGGAVLGGLLWCHEGHPVVDEHVHWVLPIEQQQEGHQALQVPTSQQLTNPKEAGQLEERIGVTEICVGE